MRDKRKIFLSIMLFKPFLRAKNSNTNRQRHLCFLVWQFHVGPLDIPAIMVSCGAVHAASFRRRVGLHPGGNGIRSLPRNRAPIAPAQWTQTSASLHRSHLVDHVGGFWSHFLDHQGCSVSPQRTVSSF
jgi:hypothetical protein